jgi:AraC-like DNA-binding protein
MLQLGPSEFFGQALWERSLPGLRLALSHYQPCHTQPWHRHLHPTFFLLLTGDHRDHTRQQIYHQAPYTLVFHPTTTGHAGELGHRPVRGLNIEFTPEWLAKHQLSESDLGTYHTLGSTRARLIALRFLATAFQAGARVDAELEMQAFELLGPVMSCRTDKPAAPRWLERADEFLQASFRDSISLRDVAREAHVHPVYLARVFRRTHGSSVSEHLRALRLNEAARLVMEGAPLAHAAYAAGFADQAHFSRCCSSIFGFSPKELRWARQAFRT